MNVDDLDDLCNDFLAAGRWLKRLCLIVGGSALAILILYLVTA
mgnify:FL=1